MKTIIRNIAKEIAESKDYFLINTIVRGSKNKPTFEIYIDGINAIKADECADFSREVKSKLDNTEFANVDYSLVVSSPGIDEPLIYLEQYTKHISREFKISFDDGEKIQSIEAKLLSINDDNLTFFYKKEELVINFKKIKKAKVKISF